jgi:phosphatidylserine decarboxylase
MGAKSIKDMGFIALQHLLPHHTLSRLVARLANSETPWIKRTFIHWFSARYRVDMSEALDSNLDSYRNFNAFFTRALKTGARPVDAGDDIIVSPADGAISQLGPIIGDRIFQAKGQSFSTLELLGGDTQMAALFENGSFATIYLSPRDYHRVHMPCSGTLRQTVYVPGRLFSVNQLTAANVQRLFARNERLVCLFDTAYGPVAVILVGAMIVAGIETVWGDHAAPLLANQAPPKNVLTDPIQLAKAAEMGRFKLGSTVVLLFGRDALRWRDTLTAGTPVRMGQTLGERYKTGTN